MLPRTHHRPAVVPCRRRLGALARRALPDAALLVALWLALAWLLMQWLLLDTRPPRWDESLYLAATRAWRLVYLAPSPAALHAALTEPGWKATPLWLALLGLVQALRGASVDYTVWASNSLALGLLLATTYGLGRSLYGRPSGLAAAALVASYAAVARLSHLYLLDVPLAAMVALALLALARLRRPAAGRRALALASAALGLALLTRYQAAVFLWLPALAVLAERWRHDRRAGARAATRRALITTAILLAGPLLLVGPVFSLNAADVLGVFIRPAATAAGGHAQVVGDVAGLDPLYYLRHWPLSEFQGQPYYPLLAALGAGLALVRRRGEAGLLLACIVGGYLALLPFYKDTRYDVPLLPAVAVLSAAPLHLLAGRRDAPWGRRAAGAVAAAVLVLAAWQVAWLGFGPTVGALPPGPRATDAAEARWWWPAAEDWREQDILRSLEAARGLGGPGRAWVAFVPSTQYQQVNLFAYLAAEHSLPLDFAGASWATDDPYSRRLLGGADLLVTKTGQVTPRPDWDAPHQAFAAALLDPRTLVGDAAAQQYALFARLPLPDGSETLLLVRRARFATWSAVQALPDARIAANQPSDVTARRAMLDGQERAAILARPPAHGETSITYALPELRRPMLLRFQVALAADAPDVGTSDGAGFRAEVCDARGCTVRYRHFLDPRDTNAHGWIGGAVDLGDYRGRGVSLRLITDAGPHGDNRGDWPLWGEPLLMPPDATIAQMARDVGAVGPR